MPLNCVPISPAARRLLNCAVISSSLECSVFQTSSVTLEFKVQVCCESSHPFCIFPRLRLCLETPTLTTAQNSENSNSHLKIIGKSRELPREDEGVRQRRGEGERRFGGGRSGSGQRRRPTAIATKPRVRGRVFGCSSRSKAFVLPRK